MHAFAADRPIEIVYLAPRRLDATELDGNARSITFDDLRHVELARRPDVWRMFRDSVIARAF